MFIFFSFIFSEEINTTKPPFFIYTVLIYKNTHFVSVIVGVASFFVVLVGFLVPRRILKMSLQEGYNRDKRGLIKL
jgi:hypothetical protein